MTASGEARLVRAYARAAYLRQRLLLASKLERLPRGLSAASACFDGIWLGLFNREALAKLDEHYYDSAEERSDNAKKTYLDDAWNLSGLQEWESKTVREHFAGCDRIVVTGAGGGREVLALIEQGHDAVGYEPHPRLAAAGAEFLERRGHPDRLRVGGRDVFPNEVDLCDGVVVGWGSYTLMPGRERRIAFLRAARDRMPDDAPILLSFFVRPEDRRYLRVLSAVANGVRRLRRGEPVELGDRLDAFYQHYFSRDEVEGELKAAGFRPVLFEPSPYGHAVGRAAA